MDYIFNNPIEKDYFYWLCGFAQPDDSYDHLFYILYRTTFIYQIENDQNRYADGILLKERFISNVYHFGVAQNYIPNACSVLEMLLALSIRCEDSIMRDDSFGDRTSEWFWMMIDNLEIRYNDQDFNNWPQLEEGVMKSLLDFMNRSYRSDGKGNIIFIPNCKVDLRNSEIWYQLNLYLNTIL